MYTGRCHSDQHISVLQILACDQFFLLTYANCKSSQVIFFLRHQSRMLCCLAADQRRLRLYTALCHTAYDRCDLLRIVLATCNIIKEEQRLPSGTGNVVHTHRYGVNTDRIMLIQKKCQLHLRAAAIGTGKKHRLLHLFDLRQRKCARKASQSTKYFFTHCPLYMLFHKLHRTVTSFNVHSCLFVIHFLLLLSIF